MGLMLAAVIGIPALLILLGVGQYLNIQTQKGPTIDAAYVRALVQHRHHPGEVELYFRSWSPLNRHQNYIVFHLDQAQQAELAQKRLQPAAAFTTNLDRSYSIYAQPNGAIERWGRYSDEHYLVIAVPTRYVAYIDTFLRFVDGAQYEARRDPANYWLMPRSVN